MQSECVSYKGLLIKKSPTKIETAVKVIKTPIYVALDASLTVAGTVGAVMGIPLFIAFSSAGMTK